MLFMTKDLIEILSTANAKKHDKCSMSLEVSQYGIYCPSSVDVIKIFFHFSLFLWHTTA